MEIKTLEVWFKDGRYKKFNNYTIDTYAIVRHKQPVIFYDRTRIKNCITLLQ